MNIQEFAKLLNVSPATVSKALNDKNDVSPETKRLIKSAARKYGYAPNAAAAQLRVGKTYKIALMFPADSAVENTASFFMKISRALQTYLLKYKYRCIVYLPVDERDEIKALKDLIKKKVVDAVLLTDTKAKDRRVNLLRKSNFPFVLFGQTQDKKNINYVDIDFRAIGRQGVKFAIEQGFKHIACVSIGDDINFGQDFANGYKEGLQEGNIAFDEELLIFNSKHDESGIDESNFAIFKEKKVDCALFVNSNSLQNAATYCHRHQIKDICMIDALYSPTQSSIDTLLSDHQFVIDYDAIAKGLSEALLLAIDGKKQSQCLISNKLIKIK